MSANTNNQTIEHTSGCLRLLRVPEVANLLQYTPDHIYRLIRRGQLRAIRSGRSVRVAQADVMSYIEANASA